MVGEDANIDASELSNIANRASVFRFGGACNSEPKGAGTIPMSGSRGTSGSYIVSKDEVKKSSAIKKSSVCSVSMIIKMRVLGSV